MTGKHILDILTTGMYPDSKIIYREYIQNACDQIDLAITKGILNEEDALIEIDINAEKRKISIRDNATGIKAADFEKSLGDIANSDKKIGLNKGFRGIGRLCGLAYCKTLRFRTTFKGEKTLSVMTCDALKMREMLDDNKKHKLDEIWNSIVEFDNSQKALSEDHYFEVELIDINKENKDLLDEQKVKEYLSFVSPVRYSNKFLQLRQKIYDHAEEINYHIDEYQIQVNGAEIFKEYTVKLKDQDGDSIKNYDEITDLEFKDFYNEDNELIAWMWIGISKFEKVIPKKNNQMRGLRLRSGNIQIGKEDVLDRFFDESRGNHYFVGEVFAVDKHLIPNSQRDYFNENVEKIEFERKIQDYFHQQLNKLYRKASEMKSNLKKLDNYKRLSDEFDKKVSRGGFIDEKDRKKSEHEVKNAQKEAIAATAKLKSLSKKIDPNSALAKVKENIERKYQSIANDTTKAKKKENSDSKKNSPYITNQMEKLSPREQKIVQKILIIITDSLADEKDTARRIIEKIKEEMNKLSNE